MLFEIHMLKNYPPVNLNRDDTGAPKTCVFGGVTRGRISSQCLKRNWRMASYFWEDIGDHLLSTRTIAMPELVKNRLLDDGIDPKRAAIVAEKLASLGKNTNKDQDGRTGGKEKKAKKEGEEKESRTKQIMPCSPEDIQAIADAAKDLLGKCKNEEEVNALKSEYFESILKKNANDRGITLDIALFGRMVTSPAIRNVEASVQVAHAISTHKVMVESDFFTAMDDYLEQADTLDYVDFNSSCYYLYASLDTDALRENLRYSEDADDIVRKTLPALLRAMAFTDPGGKQNSFAGHVLPSAVLVECKEQKVSVSLTNAYVKPVRGEDVVEESVRRLAEEADLTARSFGLPVKERLWFCVDKYDLRPESATGCFKTYPELVEAAAAALA